MLSRLLGIFAGILLSCTAIYSVAVPNDYVLIEARLTSTAQNYTYTVDQNDRTIQLQAPSATFEIISPKSLAGRTVRIIFHEGDLTDLLDESGSETAEIYMLEVWRANTELPGEIEISDYQINRIQPVLNGKGR